MISLIGQRFERLIVIEYAGRDKGYHSKWLCKCDCGNRVIVAGYNLKSGAIQSCGCLRSEQVARLNYTHGDSKTRLYSIFTNMISRTENPNATAFNIYGGRGITICQEWRHNFSAFKKWALSHGYGNNLSIDRIDNNKGYSPENCRWVTNSTQFNNRRSNCKITFDGETKTRAEWAKIKGINYHTLCTRLRDGWTIEQALLKTTKKDEKAI